MHPDRLSFTTKNTLSPSLFLLAFVFGFFYSRMQYAPKEKPKKARLRPRPRSKKALEKSFNIRGLPESGSGLRRETKHLSTFGV